MKNNISILVINGPNLNLTGTREPQIYGSVTLDDINRSLTDAAASLGITIKLFQSNHEGAIVDKIQEAYGTIDAIVINPAAYTHTSVAILDALKAVAIPAAEVHISDVDAREEFRRTSYVRAACDFTVAGHGFDGYNEAIDRLAASVGGDGK